MQILETKTFKKKGHRQLFPIIFSLACTAGSMAKWSGLAGEGCGVACGKPRDTSALPQAATQGQGIVSFRLLNRVELRNY